MIDTIQRAKYAIWNCYHKLNPNIEVNPKGYIKDSKKNLIQPDWIELIKEDYRSAKIRGDVHKIIRILKG